KETINGVSWSLVDNVANSGITFVVGIILARILGPVEFGLIGFITIFISISSTIINSGFGNALIQKKQPTEKDYNTVFLINFFLGIFLYLVLFGGAPFIAEFFSEPRLIKIIRVLSSILLINAFFIIQR